MAETKKFGPYKGSKENGGRPIYVYKKKVGSKWVTTSKNKARADYESKNGKIKSKDTTVDHKDNNHNNDSKGNLRAISRSKNTAKENKRRAGKKENEK
ncbi:MAG: HNH endonuclease [Bacteroidota bacterium]